MQCCASVGWHDCRCDVEGVARLQQQQNSSSSSSTTGARRAVRWARARIRDRKKSKAATHSLGSCASTSLKKGPLLTSVRVSPSPSPLSSFSALSLSLLPCLSASRMACRSCAAPQHSIASLLCFADLATSSPFFLLVVFSRLLLPEICSFEKSNVIPSQLIAAGISHLS